MLRWVEKEVDSPYGSVATLHWAVADADAGGTDHHDYDENDEGTVNEQTALYVELDSAEDQLGAVLWNSNTAALNYLQSHVFAHRHERGEEEVTKKPKSESAYSEGGAAPLRGVTVVELGAGVGCLGIALAMAGARVVVTDLKELVPLLEHNVVLNRNRVQKRSSGVGSCDALAWKWGPSVSLNAKKQLRKASTATTPSGASGGKAAPSPAEARTPKTSVAASAAQEQVIASMLRALDAPSEAWATCRRLLGTSAVDYVIMCDALYGNPKDWPSLLYTLSEMLVANPHRCEVINFCEQRVNNVEGAFFKLLEAENAKPSVNAEEGKNCSSTGHSSEAEITPEALLERSLRRKRGDWRWDWKTEVVGEAASDLNMTIRATRLRWVKSAGAVGAPSVAITTGERSVSSQKQPHHKRERA